MDLAGIVRRLAAFAHAALLSVAIAVPPALAAQDGPHIQAMKHWQVCVAREFADLVSSGLIPPLRENAFLACSTEELFMSTVFQQVMGADYGNFAPAKVRTQAKQQLIAQQQQQQQQQRQGPKEPFIAGRVLSCKLKIFPTQLAKEPNLPPDHEATLTIEKASVVLASESAGIMKRVSITKVLDNALALDNEGVLLLNEERAGAVKAGEMTFFTPLDSKTMASSTYFLVADCS